MLDLNDEERQFIKECLDRREPIPDNYRFRLFKNQLKSELIWPGKTLEVCKAELPFQTIEHIDAPRLNSAPHTLGSDWTNKLIWGDNKLILSSLRSGSLRRQIENAGGIKLVYIDPPFDVGADFKMPIEIGDGETFTKEPSIVEEIAYRDTWGKGVDSYLVMIYERLKLIHDLMADDGCIYMHCDYRLSGSIRIILDEIFGADNFINQVIWKSAVGDTSSKNRKFIKSHDILFLYSKSKDYYVWNDVFQDYSESSSKLYNNEDEKGVFRFVPVDNPGGGGYIYDLGYGEKKPNNGYRMPLETAQKWIEEGTLIVQQGKVPNRKKYMNTSGVRCQDIWTDISGSIRKEYPTQKPEALLERIMIASSNPGDIIADFFCGSGTTMVVAEKLGRKWVGCDLSRFAIHTSRKRIIQLQKELNKKEESYTPFDILNLGHYDREYYVGIDGSLPKDERTKQAKLKENEFYNLILKAYKSEPLHQMLPFHGTKSGAGVYIGPIDAPITIEEVEAVLKAAHTYGFKRVDVLGFEFEMSLPRFVLDEAEKKGIDLALRYIPREVFDKRAVEKDQVVFYDVAYVEATPIVSKQSVSLQLIDFGVFYRQEDLRNVAQSMRSGSNKVIVDQGSVIKLTKDRQGNIEQQTLTNHWTDWIDYWAVDFDCKSLHAYEIGGFVFENHWQTYRTKKNRKIDLESDTYTYSKPGKYKIAVKVVDVFGRDTTKVIEVEVK